MSELTAENDEKSISPCNWGFVEDHNPLPKDPLLEEIKVINDRHWRSVTSRNLAFGLMHAAEAMTCSLEDISDNSADYLRAARTLFLRTFRFRDSEADSPNAERTPSEH